MENDEPDGRADDPAGAPADAARADARPAAQPAPQRDKERTRAAILDAASRTLRDARDALQAVTGASGTRLGRADQDAFTHATQATAYVAAGLLALAAFLAWHLIPSETTPRS